VIGPLSHVWMSFFVLSLVIAR